MGRENWDDPFEDASIASVAEVKDFDLAKSHPCCTVEKFRLDLRGTPCSPWNKSATIVFVDDFMEKHPKASKAAVKEAFKSHIDRLRDVYRQQNGTLKHNQRTRNIAERRLVPNLQSTLTASVQLFERRLSVVTDHKELSRYEKVLRILGPAGMSSDESMTERGVKQYIILKKVWRGDDVTLLLRTLDALARRDRLNPQTRKRRGAPPRLRKEGPSTSDRTPPPPGLPINAFDATWLKERSDYDLELLAIDKEPFNFVPSNGLLRYVKWPVYASIL
ncbi:hypothetical protein C8Q76DRAFT_618222 [Earliella scabrosa]|nr:hypothetical protein C8Q76DRAFT_618222 [Earliella scabrosa]